MNPSFKAFKTGWVQRIAKSTEVGQIARTFALFLILTSAFWGTAVHGSQQPDGSESPLNKSLFEALTDLWSTDLPIDTFTVEQLSFQWGSLSFKHLSAVVSVSVSGQTKLFDLIECHIEELGFLKDSPSKSILFENVTMKAKVAWDGRQKEVRVENCEVNLPELGVVHCVGTFPTDKAGGSVTVRGPHLKAGRFLSQWLNLGGDFSLDFPLAVKLDLTRPASDQLRFDGTLHASGAKLQDRSFTYGGENLSPLLAVRGVWDFAKDRGTVDASLGVKTGEVLIDKIYLDFSKTPLNVQLSLDLDGSEEASITSSRISLESVWSVQGKGSVSDLSHMSGLNLDFFSPTQPIQSFWNKLVKDPFGEMYPALQGIDLDGRWGSQVHVEGSLARPVVRGWIGLDGASIKNSDKPAEAVAINCDFPFWLDLGSQVSSGEHQGGREGVIQIGNIKSSLISVDSLTLLIEAQKNGWRLLNDVNLPLGNDQFKISEFELHDVWSPKRTGQLVVLANGLQLSPLFEKLLHTNLEATLTSPKLAFRLRNSRLESLHQIKLELLSGNLQVDNLTIDRLLSPGRVVSLSASWHAIDLQKLTRLTDFGEITGRLKGGITGLQVSYGMPVAFDLVLESVPHSGVPQRISLTALKNLTALGGGQSPFMGLAGGLITTFFKDFSYKKIGIRCILENDFFTIRGLIREDETEYLVKRGLTGVNVINQHTNNRISWNDMIRRLERINRTAEQGGPQTQGEEE